MYFYIFIAILFSLSTVSCDEVVPDLCTDPKIYAADRLSSNSVRPYR